MSCPLSNTNCNSNVNISVKMLNVLTYAYYSYVYTTHMFTEGKFFRARCSCSEGMTGDFCDKAIDRCANNECFEGVSCNSSILPPDNPCGPCPPGLKSNGSKCYGMFMIKKYVSLDITCCSIIFDS